MIMKVMLEKNDLFKRIVMINIPLNERVHRISQNIMTMIMNYRAFFKGPEVDIRRNITVKNIILMLIKIRILVYPMNALILHPGENATDNLSKRNITNRGVLEQKTAGLADFHFIKIGKTTLRAPGISINHNIHLLENTLPRQAGKTKNTNLILTLNTFYIFVKSGGAI